MSVLNREEFLTRLSERFSEDSSDEAIAFIEDMTDTYNDLEQRANGDGIDWEQRYHELDDSWKKRYTKRFFSSGGGNTFVEGTELEDDTIKADEKARTIGIDDLFKED